MKGGGLRASEGYVQPVILHAAIEAADGSERRELEVTVETFKQGRAELDKLTPEGWRRVYIVTGPRA